MKDWVLITWLIVTLLWDCFIVGGTAYLVFSKHESWAWFLLALLLTGSTTIWEVLRKRYGVNSCR